MTALWELKLRLSGASLLRKCNPWHLKKACYKKIEKMEKNVIRDDALDAIMEQEFKTMHLVLLKEQLQQQEMRLLDTQSAGKLKLAVGFKRKQKVLPYVRKFPQLFRITVDEDNVQWVEFSPEMEDLLDEEDKIMKEHHEPHLITVVRKLLMMSSEGKLNVAHLERARRDFGFPIDFKSEFVYKYPEHFHVISNKDGLFLELVNWDPQLAVTAREKRLKQLKMELEEEGDDISPHSFNISVNKGFTPLQGLLEDFQILPFPSPYDHDHDPADPTSPEACKRVVGIAHEFLSLTLEKRAIIDHLSLFREEFRLPKRLEALLDCYPFIFYISPKGHYHNVFLREAYKGGLLLDRSRLATIKERILDLLKVREEPNHEG